MSGKTKYIPLMDMRVCLGTVIDEVVAGATIVLTRKGMPVAVMTKPSKVLIDRYKAAKWFLGS